MRTRSRLMAIAASAAAALLLASCAADTGEATEGEGELAGLTGTIGSKNFSEQYILAHMTSLLLNAHGAKTDVNTDVAGSNPVRTALETGEFLGYWEYTGTSWIAYNKQTEPIADAKEQFEAVKELDAKKGIAWLDPAPLNNTYAFALRESEAKRLGITKLSEVKDLPVDLQTFCLEAEFAVRDDGWPGVAAAYGIDVPESNVAVLNGGLAYTEAAKGDTCTFGEVFATDGRISALNLVVLEDDKNFFPVYQGAFTVQAKVLEEFPAIAEVMAKLSPLLTSEQMQALNARAEVDGDEPRRIAEDFLKEKGLI